MKSNAFLLKLALVGFVGTALASCGETSTSTTPSSSTSTSTSTSTSSESSSSAAPVLATGAKSFSNATYSERTDILGKLEGYAVKEHLAGLPLYENGGYAMYNPRVVKGSENYIVGYGFSNLRDGYISRDMISANESNPDWRGYLHTWDATDPATLNALNDQGSQVSDLFSYISASYFGNKMNSTKDGYEWYGVLSNDDRPIAVGDDGTIISDATSTTLASTWRIHVKTGEKGGIKYRTSSNLDSRKSYDGTYVQLDDYITAFRDILLNGSVGYYRGSELAGKTGKSGIVGAAAYYNATKKSGGADAEAFKDVGIKSGTDETGDYLQFTFMAPTNRFYAMYNLSEGLYEPVPKSFFTLVGKDAYGNYDEASSTTPVDNILSMGPYMLESWQEGVEIVFKKDTTWFESDSKTYRIPGVHIKFLPGYSTDNTLPFKEFLLGNLDSASIPLDYIAEYKDDVRSTKVPGDSVFKLNINSCNQDRWDSLFGENGSIAYTPKENYYQCKPWMANSDFLDGLSFSINREEYASSRGSIPSCNYFSTNYMSDPEDGISYDSTAQHIEAAKSVYGDTYEDYGYSTEAAKAKFKKSVDALVAAGELEKGTVANPTQISITISWMYDNMIKKYGDDISLYIQSCFNDDSVSGGTVKLTVNNVCHDATDWQDVYYNVMMKGQFDLAFGSITGNALDPLNFLEVLKSNNSSGFTLNWGPDTSELSETNQLVYGGSIWSFDSLWDAADHGALLKDGVTIPPVVLKYGAGEEDADGNFVFTFSYENLAESDDFKDDVASGKLKVTIDDFYVWNGSKFQEAIDDEGLVTGTVDEATSTVTCTITPELYAALVTNGGFYIGVDYTLAIAGVSSSGYVEIGVAFAS
ncbi:MAG: ABC transporter substrate-binding protein [Bacilli bacterium]